MDYIERALVEFINKHQNSPHRIDFAIDAMLDFDAKLYEIVVDIDVYKLKTLFPNILFFTQIDSFDGPLFDPYFDSKRIERAAVYLPRSKSCIYFYLNFSVSNLDALTYPKPIDIVVDSHFYEEIEFILPTWDGKRFKANLYYVPIAPIRRIIIKQRHPLLASDVRHLLSNAFYYRILKHFPIETILSPTEGIAIVYPDRVVLMKDGKVLKILKPTEVIDNE